MKAAQIGQGGEVFWLDMGEPVRIGDLVDRLITYATPKGAPRVAVETIGLRPGEKVREELTNQGLEMKRTSHHRIWRARQRDVPRLEVYRALRHLTRACAKGDTAGALNAVRMAVSDYVPSQAVLELAGAKPASAAILAAGGEPFR
jgi:FlaA1/EpsC-like NDP-sugar epimerase